MATGNGRGNRSGNQGTRGQNNNPEGRNQYSGMVGTARANPVAAAAAIGSAVAAGVFLWSRRNQISDQIGSLSDRVSEWREGSEGSGAFTSDDSSSVESVTSAASGSRNPGRTQSQIAEEALTLKETGATL